jgi:hypothetical protein
MGRDSETLLSHIWSRVVCGPFSEGKMNSKKTQDSGAGRRDFLKRTAVSVAAASAVAVAGKAVSASEVQVPTGAGYRETEHVKTFYKLARF